MGFLNNVSDGLSWISDYSSPYCVVSPIGSSYMDFVDEIKDNIGFVAIIEKRVEAGLPFDSLMDTMRRLLIVLSKNKNINKILLLKNSEENEELRKMHQLIERITELNDDYWERIYIRGRMKDYEIPKIKIKETISRIESIEAIDIEKTAKSLMIAKINDEKSKQKKLLLPNISDCFESHPTYMTLPLRPIATNSFNKIEDFLKYAESILMYSGEIGKDRNNLGRIQMKEQFSAKISMQDDTQDILEGYEISLGEECITNPRDMYNNCIIKNGVFANRIHRRRRGESDEYKSYDAFMTELKESIKNDRLCYSNILSLVTEEDGRYKETQVGWESITPYLCRISDDVQLSFTHTLRSVDLYNGLPFNIYFGINISKDIADNLEDSLKQEGFKVHIKLGHIEFTIKHLHAYQDSIPLDLVEIKKE